ncbi:oocyte zinc finger protein XlCOF22-like isoform X2 [Pseudophryne corroboree]|uniref:oocyte zinc finger protein XlCOF22-like isoform X2 n=1 Tax=Pseudophryne corroboree TaxID=495146 RepID=UPI0030820189
MDKDRSPTTERILNLTLEIIYLLTGEVYTVVKKTPGEYETLFSHPYESGGLSRNQSPFPVPPPHLLIHERHNDQKILELTNKIIQLLTGEEWEYIEEHRGLYKDVMMENHRTHTSLDGTSNRNTPERCPRRLYSQDHTEENHSVPQEDQGEKLTNIKAEDLDGDVMYVPNIKAECTEGEEETYVTDIKIEIVKEEEEEAYVRGDQQCKEEEIPTDVSTDGNNIRNTSEERLRLSSDGDTEDNDITRDSPEEKPITQIIHPATHNADISSNPSNHVECCPDGSDIGDSLTLHTVDKILPSSIDNKCTESRKLIANQSAMTAEKQFPCSDCGKCFTRKSSLVIHERSHKGQKPFPCSECGKCFTSKSALVKHERIHIGDKPFPCSECGKCFTRKSYLVIHQRHHTGEKPFPCSECWKCFTHKSALVRHESSHVDEKPFSCSECGKCFTSKSALVIHERSHTGDNQFPCSECGKYFTRKSSLVIHQRHHTGDKLFSCSECWKCFTDKSALVRHEKSHRGEKPFACSDCGKCFTQISNLASHERSHTGEKPFPCSECSKCFTRKSYLITHQRSHTGEKPFPCSECGKCFTRKSSLITHERSHIDEKQLPSSEWEMLYI